jgi:predicted DNA-binding transcriptional regulator AlpA
MPESSAGIEKLLLTPREAAAALSISERTLWAITAPRGPLPAVRPGGGRSVRYSMTSLRRYIDDAEAAQMGGAS